MKNILIAGLLSSSSLIAGATNESSSQNIKVQVTERGFEPSEIKVKAGSHVVLQVTRTTDLTCATQIQIKELKIKKDLPLNKEIKVDLGLLKKGDIRFACGMNMVSAHVIAE
ncbi:MAG: cupredoxin domain-containing protein [Pseudobdellovibrionaceae bacterium]|nr:cupredoxin domain-containing protein [Deltaproteobacteria bacterium]